MAPSYILLPPLFALAGYWEVRSRRIPNWLTVSAMVCGLLAAPMTGGWPALKAALLGGLVGGGVFLPFFLLGVMGGGDFKLMTAVGVIVGYPMVWSVLYFTCLSGGALALIYMIMSGRFFATLAGVGRVLLGRRRRTGSGLQKAPTIPYGIAIAIGTLWAILRVL
ncbi:MAG: peptidase A24 [Lentisphaerae bacterium]|nr:peptidase A24 [Lentisphaerota bacterium]